MSALFGASEAFLILVTLYEKAKQKSSRGGGTFFVKYYIVQCMVLILKTKLIDQVRSLDTRRISELVHMIGNLLLQS